MNAISPDTRKTLQQLYPLPVLPKPEKFGLTATIHGLDHDNNPVSLEIIEEQAWTIYRNGQEIVTVMNVGDYPALLGLGYLINQQLLDHEDTLVDIDIDPELQVVVMRTEKGEGAVLSRQVRTSGCAEGTMYEKVMQRIADKALNSNTHLHTNQMQRTLQQINQLPSLYLSAGAIHGCVLCQDDLVLAYMEDVGRHNAVDKIAGLMMCHEISGEDHWLYTTGRLTTEMVLKAVQMDIPVLVSRSGFTARGVALAKQCRLTLVGRARGKRFQILSHPERLIFDHLPS